MDLNDLLPRRAESVVLVGMQIWPTRSGLALRRGRRLWAAGRGPWRLPGEGRAGPGRGGGLGRGQAQALERQEVVGLGTSGEPWPALLKGWMLAAAAEMIDDLLRGGWGPSAETTASAPATAGWIAAGSNTSATTSFSRWWRTGSLAGP